MNFEKLEADVNMILKKHYTSGRGGKPVSFVGIHYNYGDLTVEGCYNVWQTREASAHYQVESSGRWGQLVWDKDTAWALGNFDKNQRSINIEHANKPDGSFTEACLDTGAHIVAAVCKAYKLGRPQWDVNVIPHKAISPTSCPGELYGRYKDIYIQKAQYWYDVMTGAINPNPEPKPEPVPELPDSLKGFVDVDPTAWYVDALDKAVKAGYIHGYSSTNIGPGDSLTRGQAVVMIANAAGAKFDNPYADVVPDNFYYNAVEWAKENGVVSSDFENFRPNDNATRQEFVTMLYNWQHGKNVGEPTGYPDWNEVADWAKSAVAWAIENGVISGSNGHIAPNANCTRAEAAAMMVNLLLK